MPKKKDVKQTNVIKKVDAIKLVGATSKVDLIKVMTIREKFVEQMPTVPVFSKEHKAAIDLHEHFAILGYTSSEYLVLQDIKGKLHKLSVMNYVDYMLLDLPRTELDNDAWNAMQKRVKQTYNQLFLT